MTTFGASAPAKDVFAHFGFTPEHVAEEARCGARARQGLRGAAMSVAQGVNQRLAALTEAGVSIWLDQIRRSLIESGELERMVREDSLRGVTANPSIFEKAILGSPDYDEELAELSRQGTRRARHLPPPGGGGRAARGRRAAARLGGHRGRGRLRVARGRPAPRARHGGHDRAGAPVLGADRAAQRDDQDPGHRGGRPGDRAGDLRRHQHQRHAAVRRRDVRARPPRPSSAASSAGARRASRSTTSTRWRASSSRAWTPRPTSGSMRSGAPTCRAPPRWPTRATPTTTSRTSSTATASRRCGRPARTCSARCGRPPAPRTRATRRRSTSTAWWRPTRSTRCRCPRWSPSPSTERCPAPRPTRIPPRWSGS